MELPSELLASKPGDIPVLRAKSAVDLLIKPRNLDRRERERSACQDFSFPILEELPPRPLQVPLTPSHSFHRNDEDNVNRHSLAVNNLGLNVILRIPCYSDLNYMKFLFGPAGLWRDGRIQFTLHTTSAEPYLPSPWYHPVSGANTVLYSTCGAWYVSIGSVCQLDYAYDSTRTT